MRLNVYLVSHPIIQKISAQMIYSIDSKNPISYNYHGSQPLHMLLIYEVIRKWIKIYKIYIPYIDFIKESYVFDSKDSYIIITNLMNCGNILPNINSILPQVYIQHLNLNNTSMTNINDNDFNSNIINIIKSKKIIIMDNFLKLSIIQLLDYLIITKEVKIETIKIICITCTNKTLEKIANKYPLMSIYTTKIYNN